MSKISYDDYLNLLRDPDKSDKEIAAYSRVVRGTGSAFALELRPDPAKVDMSEDEEHLENVVKIGNSVARWRRQRRFKKRIDDGDTSPVLVSEGDSWFQFPLIIDETIDHLGSKYLIWSVGAAGDTLHNMVNGPRNKGKTEYMLALEEQRERVKGFLFSAAGNDIIGESADTDKSVLLEILRPFNGDASDVVGHINLVVLGKQLNFLHQGYTRVINTIRADDHFTQLPIIIHGYDYVIPYPAGPGDPRNPAHAKKNEWLGAPLDERGIKDTSLRRNIMKRLIDELYAMLFDIAGDSQSSKVWVVDCRNALPEVKDWADEIHGTSKGFAKVAIRFEAVLKKALAA